MNFNFLISDEKLECGMPSSAILDLKFAFWLTKKIESIKNKLWIFFFYLKVRIHFGSLKVFWARHAGQSEESVFKVTIHLPIAVQWIQQRSWFRTQIQFAWIQQLSPVAKIE